MDNTNELAPSERRELHLRQVEMRFFERADGLFEVEGALRDTKTDPFRVLFADQVAAGNAIHDIVVTLVIDETMEVRDARAQMRSTPFARCVGAADTLAPLRGLRIGAGWNRLLRERLGGAASCSHVVELLGQLATTAYQGLAPRRLARINLPGSEAQRQSKVDSCYAFAAHGDVVAKAWPHLHRAEARQDDAEPVRRED